VEKAMYPVNLLCRLMQVSRSGFYEYLRRPKGAVPDPLVLRVKGIHEESRGNYGSRRMAKQLQ
jgi:putative transposase